MAETETVVIDDKPTPETPAVVATSKGVSLADRLRLSELPLATTAGGKAFALKALHPSEHTIKSARVPGGNSMSVALCCDMVQTVPLTDDNLAVFINLIPSILTPCSINYNDSGGSSHAWTFVNNAFGGQVFANMTTTDLQSVIAALGSRIENYRVTSQSATVELIAPSLTDQGTITAAQFRLAPRTTELSFFSQGGNAITFQPDCIEYPEPPVSSELVLGTSAYTAKAREGVYMPLKLTKFKWQHFADRAIYVNAPNPIVLPYGTSHSLTTPLFFPYAELRGSTTVYNDCAVPKFCGNNFGRIVVAGCSKNTSLRVRVRQVVEITARPSTTYAPLLEVALPPDETSMKMYYEVSSRMADAYPASYNDLGTLWEKIKGIAKSVLPYVDPALDIASKIPVIGGVAQAAKVALPAVKGVVSAVSAAKKSVQDAKRQKAAKQTPKTK